MHPYNLEDPTLLTAFLSFLNTDLTFISSFNHVGEDTEHWRAPIEVKLEIPYFTVSGLQVRYLKIIEKSGYQALPWVRYITTNGNYQLRMS